MKRSGTRQQHHVIQAAHTDKHKIRLRVNAQYWVEMGGVVRFRAQRTRHPYTISQCKKNPGKALCRRRESNDLEVEEPTGIEPGDADAAQTLH